MANNKYIKILMYECVYEKYNENCKTNITLMMRD